MTIKDIRKKFKLSQEELAAATGFRQEQISVWETGARTPSPLTQQKLAATVKAMVADPSLIERIKQEIKNRKRIKPIV